MRKEGKRKALAALVCGSMLTVALVGGTLAYLQDDDSDVNVMTLGNVSIEQHEYERVQKADGTYEMVTSEKYGEGYKLQDFNQNKPLYPATGAITGWGTKVPFDQIDKDKASGAQAVFAGLNNVQDKFVLVENTGKSDAYVRTLIALEYGSNTKDIIGISTGDFWTWNDLDIVEIDGNNYNLFEAVYKGSDTRHVGGILSAGEYTYNSLGQIYLSPEATNEDVEALDGNGNGTYDILVLSQAVQTEGFANAQTALDTAFGKASDKAAEWFSGMGAADTWDGTADTTWCNDADTEFTIETAEQLAGLAELVDGGNDFAGKTIKLGKDLDLYAEDENGERVSFDPIGYGYDVVFKGTFDGQGHTISNLYQNGWALGLDYSTEGGGLFASVVDSTIKNVNIDNAEIVMECIDMGVLVGYSYGDCTYENITVSNSTIANYQRYTGGVVGEVNGVQTFKNVDVKDTVVSSLWGDFDCSLGGIVGGKWGVATLTFEDCDVACELNAYNDVTSSYQWYAYRRAGMLIGNSEETKTVDGRTSATASYLTAKNCTVTYEDWANYTYCEFAGTSWPYVRVQAGYSCDAYSNPRYGVATDANGNKAVDDTHVHNEGEDHNILLTFDQLFGGGQGVYGTATHDGVAVVYNNK